MTEKDKRKEDLKRIRDFYQDLPDSMKAIAFPMLDNLSFIDDQLEKLRIEIDSSGPIEEYTNGSNQKGMKQSASIQAYCSLLKSYTSIYTKVCNLVKDNKKDIAHKKLQDFLNEVED